MDEMLLYLALIVIASIAMGIVIGREMTKGKFEGELQRSTEKAKEESRTEKANLSRDLQEELGKIRESILGSALAYQNAVKTVYESLGTPPEMRRLSSPMPQQLQLVLDGVTEEEQEAAKRPKEKSKNEKPSAAEHSAIKLTNVAEQKSSAASSDSPKDSADQAAESDEQEDSQAKLRLVEKRA